MNNETVFDGLTTAGLELRVLEIGKSWSEGSQGEGQ